MFDKRMYVRYTNKSSEENPMVSGGNRKDNGMIAVRVTPDRQWAIGRPYTAYQSGDTVQTGWEWQDR
jgi:hypothetical protein